jgi:hypothetical protein
MALLVFALSLVLLIAGLASGYMSLDLIPTGIGVLYAVGGAVGVSMAIVAFALGALIRRIDALAELVKQSPNRASAVVEAHPSEEAPEPPPLETEAVAQEAVAEPLAEDGEAPVNQNRSGHLPTLGAIEHAIETPEAPASLIGRYSSGGANYMIFDDGSIEAETQEGTFKFASMGDFKQYLADRKGQRA